MAIPKIMCFGNANKEDPEAKKSREIEKQLREDQRRMQKEVKMLLLGARASPPSPALRAGKRRTNPPWQVRASRANRRC